MPADFYYFQLLPVELQLMVFEEFIRAAQKPRIVLLNAEGCEGVLDWEKKPRLGWRMAVDNREQLHWENISAVARGLLALCSSSRRVATQFLDRPQRVIKKAPEKHPALMGLGLSLEYDLFWLPDTLAPFIAFHRRLWAGGLGGYSDERRMRTIMISLDAFEVALHWAQDQWFKDESTKLGADLHRVLWRLFTLWYWGARNLIIMVDVPRRHVSLDEFKIFRTDGRTRSRMLGEHESARCNSVFGKYLALRNRERQKMPGNSEESRRWPQHLYFAFQKRMTLDTTS